MEAKILDQGISNSANNTNARVNYEKELAENNAKRAAIEIRGSGVGPGLDHARPDLGKIEGMHSEGPTGVQGGENGGDVITIDF